VLLVLQVVDVAVPGRASAAGEYAASVAGGDGASLLAGPGLRRVVRVEHGAFAVEEDGDQGAVAQQLFGGLLGELPAVAAQDQVVEVVQLAQVGEGAQVDVDVGDHTGAGACAAPDPPAAFALGSAEPAADGVELFGPIEHVHIGIEIGVVEGFVEGVGGGPAVEGVLGGDVLELAVVFVQTVAVLEITEIVVVGGVEAGSADVVEGIGAAFAEAALVGGTLGVGVVGPRVEAVATFKNAAGERSPWISPPPNSRWDNVSEWRGTWRISRS
jgi:hypothetical protein